VLYRSSFFCFADDVCIHTLRGAFLVSFPSHSEKEVNNHGDNNESSSLCGHRDLKGKREGRNDKKQQQ
jgi:hypothetical protein